MQLLLLLLFFYILFNVKLENKVCEVVFQISVDDFQNKITLTFKLQHIFRYIQD